MKSKRWHIACAAIALLSGCGQKGPLYLPEKKARVVPPVPAAPPAATAPEKTDPDQKDATQ
jgi:predicted small lipoprotein YifL